MSIVLDGTLGITSPAETVQGALTTTGNTILGDATTDTLNVGAGGLVKDASGNVGIGTASPGAKLDVNGSAFASFLKVSGGSGVATSAGLIDFSGGATRLISAGADASTYGQFILYGANAGVANAVEQMRIDSSGNLLFNSGYGSAATAYGCRAWVNFNGVTTAVIRASGNVSSVTRNAAGDYTVNFTTAMPDANYSAAFMIGAGNDAAYGGTQIYAAATNRPLNAPATMTTSALRFVTAGKYAEFFFSDAYVVTVAIFR